MFRRCYVLVFAALLLPAWTAVQAQQEKSREDVSPQIQAMQAQIDSLQARIQSLEDQVKALEKSRDFSQYFHTPPRPRFRIYPKTPSPQPDVPGKGVPPDWEKRYFNGMPYYIVPLQEITGLTEVPDKP